MDNPTLYMYKIRFIVIFIKINTSHIQIQRICIWEVY